MTNRWRSIERAGRRVPWVATAVLGIAFGPGLLRSSLLQGDLPGHLEMIRWSAEHVWPLPWGWDPRYLLGIPLGVLYPPLLSWLGGGLAKVVGAEWALRAILVASILALPAALAAAGRGLGLRRGEAGWSCAAGLAVLWLPGRGLGGSLHQTLVAGNAANALALPLALWFLGSLRRGLGRPARWAAPSALLASTLLAHFLMGMVCGAALGVYAVCGSLHRLGIRIGRAIVLGGAGLLAAAPFLVPFAVHFRDGSPDAIAFSPLPSVFEWVSLAALAVLVAAASRASRRVLGPAVVLLAAFYLLRGVVFPWLGAPPFRMEYHRFRLFLYLGLVPASFLALRARGGLGDLRLMALPLPAVLAAALAIFVRYDARGPLPVPLPDVRPDLRGHRILVLASPAAQNGSWHGLQHLLPRVLGAYGAKGLFVEASPFSRKIFELEKIASSPDCAPRWWAIRTDPIESLRASSDREVAARFRDLGVDVVIAREPVAPVVRRLALGPAEDLGGGYTLYRLPAVDAEGNAEPGSGTPGDRRSRRGAEDWLGLALGAAGGASLGWGFAATRRRVGNARTARISGDRA